MFTMAKESKLKLNCKDWTLQFIDEPFKLFKMSNVFTDPKQVSKLEKEFDNLPFSHNVLDIFSFSQTKDLFSVVNETETALSKFLQCLEFLRSFLSNKFNVPLDCKISVSGSKYSFGDYLLCHDDKIEDRHLAFVYYLNSTWEESWGGSLDIFDHDKSGQPSDVRYSFFPQFNSLIFFEVGNLTYHQVSEVLTTNNSRKTLNGWFHSKKALELKPLLYSEPPISRIESLNRGSRSYFQTLVNKEFLDEKYTSLITEGIHENNVMMLQDFLKESVFDAISNELNSSSILWTQQGPANRRKYDVAVLKKLPTKTKSLVTHFQSKFICSYLESITGYKLFKKPKGNDYVHLVAVEIQFWQRGCYSLLTHNDANFEDASLDVLIFFNVSEENVEYFNKNSLTVSGNIYYCEEGAVTVKYEIEPNNNSICLVYKRKNETSFVPYISQNTNQKFHLIRLSYKL